MPRDALMQRHVYQRNIMLLLCLDVELFRFVAVSSGFFGEGFTSPWLRVGRP